jgi:hypothetical protein
MPDYEGIFPFESNILDQKNSPQGGGPEGEKQLPIRVHPCQSAVVFSRVMGFGIRRSSPAKNAMRSSGGKKKGPSREGPICLGSLW